MSTFIFHMLEYVTVKTSIFIIENTFSVGYYIGSSAVSYIYSSLVNKNNINSDNKNKTGSNEHKTGSNEHKTENKDIEELKNDIIYLRSKVCELEKRIHE